MNAGVGGRFGASVAVRQPFADVAVLRIVAGREAIGELDGTFEIAFRVGVLDVRRVVDR